MNSTTVIGAGSLGKPGPSWHVKGTGDFYGNGTSDMLWRQTASGAMDIETITNAHANGNIRLSPIDASWQVAGGNAGGGNLGSPFGLADIATPAESISNSPPDLSTSTSSGATAEYRRSPPVLS